LDNPSNLVRRAWPDYRRRLKPPRRLPQEVRSPALVDRFAQGAQYGQFFGGQRHGSVSAGGGLRDSRFRLLTETGIAAVSAPMPAFWGVVRSLPKREVFAAERLRMDQGFEVFLPLVQTKRASQPLFSSYFFCRIIDRWRSINSTLGVLCLVRTGDCPARCPDREIDSLKAMIDGHGYIKLPEASPPPARRKIAIGAKVRIASGPFGGMSGLYAGQSTRERELILLDLLGRQTPVTIGAGLVVPQ
jgi:transcriptional antiterminator RfaH